MTESDPIVPRRSTSKVPWRRIYEDIRMALREGELQPGDMVGPVPVLMSEKRGYKTSRNTVLKALDLLREEGYVYTEQGLGVFVTDRQHWPK